MCARQVSGGNPLGEVDKQLRLRLLVAVQGSPAVTRRATFTRRGSSKFGVARDAATGSGPVEGNY